jgi:guanylate kinase
MDIKNYQPAPHVLDRLKQVDFVAVVGPTAAGKNSVMAAAAGKQPALHSVLNNTSRVPRPGERPGLDFNFLTRAEMEVKIEQGGYAQVAPTILDDLYATSPESYTTEGIAMMPVMAEAVPTFRSLPFKRQRYIYIVPPDWQTWQERIKVRAFTPEQMEHRLKEAKESLQFALDDTETLFVINDQLDQAAADFIAIALGQPLSERLQADQARARDIVRSLFKRLG